MIWVRRILAIFLAILFVILLPLLIFVSEVDSTASDPDFYNHQMEKADVYNYLYDEVLPAALDEVQSEDLSENPVNTAGIQSEIISTARSILPPEEWLQPHFEAATREIIPYFLGSTDEFQYTVDLKTRVQAAPSTITQQLLRGEVFSTIYDDIISYSSGKIVDNLDKLPYALTLAEDRVQNSFREVISQDWAASEIESAMESMVPYLTLESDDFTVTINLKERVDAVATAVLDLLSTQQTYDYLFDEVIEPVIREEIELIVDLPYEISLTGDEITSAIEQVLPPEWVKSRLQDVIEAITAYVKGDSDTINIAVDLSDRKPAALAALIDLGDQKLEEIFNGLPICTMEQFNAELAATSAGELPDCRPAGYSYPDFKSRLGIDLSASIQQRVLDKITDQWFYTEADLRESMGEENRDFLDDAREYVRNGWTFTDVDLKERLDSPDDEATLEDIRDWLGNNAAFTEQDLNDRLSSEDRDELDDAREQVDKFRSWLWVLWVVPILLLIGIGFLGGRSWKGRSYWALSVLLITSIVVIFAIAVTYSAIVEPEVEEAFDVSEYEGMELVIVEKANEVIENIAGDFSSNLRNKALYLTIFSGVVLAGIFGWNYYQRRREGALSTENRTEPDV
ncbi:MAG: hypothetical protein R6U89_02375 [Dehalococcoidia bacterium]